jgi:hypothetical protein
VRKKVNGAGLAQHNIPPEKNPLRGEWVLDGAVELVVLKETRSGIGITDNLAYNRVRHTTHRRIIITEMLTHMIAGNNLQ